MPPAYDGRDRGVMYNSNNESDRWNRERYAFSSILFSIVRFFTQIFPKKIYYRYGDHKRFDNNFGRGAPPPHAYHRERDRERDRDRDRDSRRLDKRGYVSFMITENVCHQSIKYLTIIRSFYLIQVSTYARLPTK